MADIQQKNTPKDSGYFYALIEIKRLEAIFYYKLSEDDKKCTKLSKIYEESLDFDAYQVLPLIKHVMPMEALEKDVDEYVDAKKLFFAELVNTNETKNEIAVFLEKNKIKCIKTVALPLDVVPICCLKNNWKWVGTSVKLVKEISEEEYGEFRRRKNERN